MTRDSKWIISGIAAAILISLLMMLADKLQGQVKPVYDPVWDAVSIQGEARNLGAFVVIRRLRVYDRDCILFDGYNAHALILRCKGDNQ